MAIPPLESIEILPLSFRVQENGWELVQSPLFLDCLVNIAVWTVLGIALSWPLVHFHPWGRISAFLTVLVIWVGLVWLLQGSICGLFVPTRITFDGDSLTRIRPSFSGIQRLVWHRWQISNLEIRPMYNRHDPRANLLVTFRGGRNQVLLAVVPEQPLRRAAALIAESMQMKPRA